jgi:hypothetical protein
MSRPEPASVAQVRSHLARAAWRTGDRPQVSLSSGCQRRRRKAAQRRARWEDGTYGVLVINVGADA